MGFKTKRKANWTLCHKRTNWSQSKPFAWDTIHQCCNYVGHLTWKSVISYIFVWNFNKYEVLIAGAKVQFFILLFFLHVLLFLYFCIFYLIAGAGEFFSLVLFVLFKFLHFLHLFAYFAFFYFYTFLFCTFAVLLYFAFLY